jgi:hypothetical protein
MTCAPSITQIQRTITRISSDYTDSLKRLDRLFKITQIFQGLHRYEAYAENKKSV